MRLLRGQAYSCDIALADALELKLIDEDRNVEFFVKKVIIVFLMTIVG